MGNIAKKLASVLLALALLCTLAALPAQAAGTKPNLVVLGDSIPAGEGATGEAKAYAWLIAEEMGYDLANHAVGGHTSGHLLELLANDTKGIVGDIRDADVIVLNIGGNNLLGSNVITLVLRAIFLKDTSTVDPYIADFAVEFADIVEQILALKKSGAKFIVQTLYNCMAGIPLVSDAYEAAVSKLNAVYFKYLDDHPGAYEIADIYRAFKGIDGLVFSDRLHPSDAGHRRIADVLEAMLKGAPLVINPPEIVKPNFFKQVVIFFRALYDYLSYWLSRMSLLDLLKTAFSFI
ncbi:MAG: SGNH/GDSL hydrolase family protein [Firmicutes bacterium]|nr:SGNH/GDSL hydrolase family protein [Bacillota bacterium]